MSNIIIIVIECNFTFLFLKLCLRFPGDFSQQTITIIVSNICVEVRQGADLIRVLEFSGLVGNIND